MTKRIISLMMAITMVFGIMATGMISAAAEADEAATTGQETATEQTVQSQTEETTTQTTVPQDTVSKETEPEATEPEATEPEATEPEVTEPEVKEPEDTGFSASDDCIRILKLEEGFSKKPYWDYSQWTVGYGTRCPDDMLEYYSTYGISEAEAETLLRNHLGYIYRDLNRFMEKNNLTLTQNQFDALVLMSYNCGTSWAFDTSGTLYKAVVSGATGNELIRAFARWCRAGGQVQTYLLRRRLSESNIYLNSVYSQTPPDNYCYVIYDANGGTVSPSSQGYDSNLTAVPNTEATYAGYTFVGWFTEATGGTQVTVLDVSTKNVTLYAHWVDADGNAPEDNQQTVNVTVTVTDTDVNLRKGPGTNYTIIGSANTGDQFTITAVANGSGYTWGQYDGGWICLKYTNYETVIQEGGSSPEVEPTEPEPTEPEPTEPEPTEPESTEPEPTEPEDEKPNVRVTGTVKADGGLCVRSGPSTGYTALRYLADGSKVEILEQQTVGSMVWGKISDGWISMKYVVLDTPDNSGDGENSTGDSSGDQTGDSKPSVLKGTVKANGGLRVRKGPGISYGIVEYLYDGAKVEITQTQKEGSVTWGKVANGWISMDYVKLDSSLDQTPQQPQEPQEPQQPQSQTGTVRVDSYLRIRNGPGTSYAICGYLYNGNTVQITETRTVGATLWGKTDSGWISMDYIVLSGNSSNSGSGSTATITKTVNTDCLRIRESAGTSSSIVGYLYFGAKVEILETTTQNGSTWGRISKGWICMDYVK